MCTAPGQGNVLDVMVPRFLNVMIHYTQRLSAGPLTRCEFIRSFVFSLGALPASCLRTAQGGSRPRKPNPPGTPSHPTPPLVQLQGLSEWMAIPSAWLFQEQPIGWYGSRLLKLQAGSRMSSNSYFGACPEDCVKPAEALELTRS